MDPAPADPRLFLALWPDDAARAALLAWRDRWPWSPGAVPVPATDLHLTLHFLGRVPPARIDELCAACAGPADDIALQFGRAELWPHGIAVVCPLALPGSLLQLHARLGIALAGLGFTLDTRAFRPHVTLARKAAGTAVPDPGPDFAWRVHDGFALVQSLPGRAGYRVLRRLG